MIAYVENPLKSTKNNPTRTKKIKFEQYYRIKDNKILYFCVTKNYNTKLRNKISFTMHFKDP